MKIIIPGLISVFSYGCVSIPDSSDLLVKNSKTVETICYEEKASIIESRVKDYLASCYKTVESSAMLPAGGNYISMPLKMEFSVEEEALQQGMRFSVRGKLGYAYSVEIIEATGECKTRMSMYAVTGFWKKAFRQTDLAAKGEDAKCTF